MSRWHSNDLLSHQRLQKKSVTNIQKYAANLKMANDSNQKSAKEKKKIEKRLIDVWAFIATKEEKNGHEKNWRVGKDFQTQNLILFIYLVRLVGPPEQHSSVSWMLIWRENLLLTHFFVVHPSFIRDHESCSKIEWLSRQGVVSEEGTDANLLKPKWARDTKLSSHSSNNLQTWLARPLELQNGYKSLILQKDTR